MFWGVCECVLCALRWAVSAISSGRHLGHELPLVYKKVYGELDDDDLVFNSHPLELFGV